MYGFWASVRDENCGRFSVASAVISSSARRPMPSAVAATPAASSVKFGKCPSGASIVGPPPNGRNVRSSGTTAPSTEKSSEPDPRRPDVCHVSWNVTSAASR